MWLLDLERGGERVERPGADQGAGGACGLLAIVCLRVPGDVFAEALLPTAHKADERRDAREIASHGGLEPLESIALDREWQLGDPRVRPGKATHTLDPTKARSPGVPGLLEELTDVRWAH